MRRYCLALDLKDDPEAIATYRAHHQQVWPEIERSIKDAGVRSMEIFLVGNRLFMIMVVEAWFSFESKAAEDLASPRVQAWETLMDTFQQRLPCAKPGEKWVLMERIYSLDGEPSESEAQGTSQAR